MLEMMGQILWQVKLDRRDRVLGQKNLRARTGPDRVARAASPSELGSRDRDIVRRFDPGRSERSPLNVYIQTESVRTLAQSVRRGPLGRALRSYARSGRQVGAPR